MIRVCLVNMPFGALHMPSLGLMQIKAAVERELGPAVSVEILYLNLEFFAFMGDARLCGHALAPTGYLTGFGDWFFRQAAFPDVPDNRDEYMARYYFDDDTETQAIRRAIAEKRAQVGTFLDQQLARHRLAEADIVGFTAFFAQTTPSLAMAARVKQSNPEVITVMGGAACEGIMGQELARQAVHLDYVFSGPARVSFPEFVKHRLAGNREVDRPINGVHSCAPAGQAPTPSRQPSTINRQPSTHRIPADDLPIDTLLDLDYESFLSAFEAIFPGGEPYPVLLFETSRGCSWGEHSPCTFCGLNGLRHCHTAMRPENARRTITSLFRYAPRCRVFEAVDNSLPAGYVADVFTSLEPPPGIKIVYEVRADLDATEIATLCDAGVTEVQPGIEALSSTTLRLMNKGTSAFRNIRFLKDCATRPIYLNWNLLVFSPGEPEATFAKYLRDIPLLTHLHPPADVFPVNYVRFSRYFQDPDAYGLDPHPQDFYGLTFPFEEQAVHNIACHFVDRDMDGLHLDRWLDALRASVSFWRRRWFNEDDLEQARLCLEGTGAETVIHDSRSGRPDVYPVDAATVALLLYMERPRRLAEISTRLDAGGEPDALDRLGALQERGLLFEEDGQYLSLVIQDHVGRGDGDFVRHPRAFLVGSAHD